MAKTTIQFGFEHYRAGAIERIGDAYLLQRGGRFAGSIYFGGRAVESIFRALVWKSDSDVRQGRSSLDTGHDLRELLGLLRNLGVFGTMPAGERRMLEERVLRVSRLWYNNMRFAASKHIETRWRRAGEFGRGRPSKTFKEAVAAFFSDCSAIIRRCEELCEKVN